jgi:hypothetical protein
MNSSILSKGNKYLSVLHRIADQVVIFIARSLSLSFATKMWPRTSQCDWFIMWWQYYRVVCNYLDDTCTNTDHMQKKDFSTIL